MATEILKEFLVAVGFKVDEASYKKQADAVEKVGRQLNQVDRDDRDRVTSEGRRHEIRKRNAEGLAFALGGVATAAAAAATVVGAAMVKIAGGFDNLYFVSQRTGASVNQIKGLSYAFSQVGSSADSAMQAIESFAKTRRTNPGINGLLRSYGVDTKGDTADVLTRSVDAIQARHPYYTGAQVAGILDISEDQFQTFTKYREEIKKFREEYAQTQRSLGVNSDETARSSATIQRAIGSLTATLGVLTEKLYTALAPVLERIVKGFKDWIESHPEQVEAIMHGIAQAVEAVGRFLGQVGDWLGDEQNQKLLATYWDKFLQKVQETAKEIKDLLEMLFKIGRYLGLGSGQDIIGTLATRALGNQPQAGGGDGGQGGYTPLLQRGWNAVRRAFGGGGGDDGPIPGGTARIGSAARNQNAQTIMSELRRGGYNDNAIAAIVGSMQTESSFNPSARNAVGGGHTGLWQWDRNRWPRVSRWITERGGNPADAAWQTRAWIAEHNARPGDPMYDHNRTQRGGEMLRNNPSLDQAIHGVRESERFGAGEEGGRAANARGWLPHVQSSRQTPASQAQSQQPAAASPAQPRMNMTPGGFNVNDYLRTQPMGAAATSTTNSRTVSQNNPVTVNVQGATDPQATGTAVARAMGQANDMSLRNVQTAIR